MGAELEADGKALVRSSVLRQHGHYLGELFVHDVADAFEGLQCVFVQASSFSSGSVDEVIAVEVPGRVRLCDDGLVAAEGPRLLIRPDIPGIHSEISRCTAVKNP